MTLWMTLRIGGLYLGPGRGQRRSRPGQQPPRAQRGTRPGDLSTLAVHEIAALTCTDEVIPRIHPAYYDYHLSIYRDPKNQVAPHLLELRANPIRGHPGPPSPKPGPPTPTQARLSEADQRPAWQRCRAKNSPRAACSARE